MPLKNNMILWMDYFASSLAFFHSYDTEQGQLKQLLLYLYIMFFIFTVTYFASTFLSTTIPNKWDSNFQALWTYPSILSALQTVGLTSGWQQSLHSLNHLSLSHLSECFGHMKLHTLRLVSHCLLEKLYDWQPYYFLGKCCSDNISWKKKVHKNILLYFLCLSLDCC